MLSISATCSCIVYEWPHASTMNLKDCGRRECRGARCAARCSSHSSRQALAAHAQGPVRRLQQLQQPAPGRGRPTCPSPPAGTPPAPPAGPPGCPTRPTPPAAPAKCEGNKQCAHMKCHATRWAEFFSSCLLACPHALHQQQLQRRNLHPGQCYKAPACSAHCKRSAQCSAEKASNRQPPMAAPAGDAELDTCTAHLRQHHFAGHFFGHLVAVEVRVPEGAFGLQGVACSNVLGRDPWVAARQLVT